jgi:hypothetical protein
MATPLHPEHGRKGYLGTILVTLGSVALVADLEVLAQPLARLAEKLHEGVFGLLPSLGLSFLNAAGAFAFHQIDYFSLISRILVLFTAAVAVVVGLVLLRSQSEYPTRANRMNASTFRKREIDNG